MIPLRTFMSALPRRPAIVAHRGAWQDTTENSVAAIEAAIAGGFDLVEVDVRKSSDGVLYLLHDDDLVRMADNDQALSALTYADLAAIPLRQFDGGAAAPFGSDRIPTLEAALEAGRGKIYFDLDVKSEADLDAVGAEVARLGLNDQVDLKIDVAQDEDVQTLRDMEARHGIMVMPKTSFTASDADTMLDLVARTGASVVEANYDRLSTLADRRARFEAAGLAIWVNTLTPVACDGDSDARAVGDPDAVWGRLCDAGVGVIQTDAPAALATWRDLYHRD